MYRLIGDRLFAQLNEAEYADLYSSERKPGISPILLAFVSVFQFMEKPADRQAVRALQMRLNWKDALHLPLGQDKLTNGISPADFQFDANNNTVPCPTGSVAHTPAWSQTRCVFIFPSPFVPLVSYVRGVAPANAGEPSG